jgi:hypothetical protein
MASTRKPLPVTPVAAGSRQTKIPAAATLERRPPRRRRELVPMWVLKIPGFPGLVPAQSEGLARELDDPLSRCVHRMRCRDG